MAWAIRGPLRAEYGNDEETLVAHDGRGVIAYGAGARAMERRAEELAGIPVGAANMGATRTPIEHLASPVSAFLVARDVFRMDRTQMVGRAVPPPSEEGVP